MGARTFQFSSDFDSASPLGGATATTNGSGVGVVDTWNSPDWDNEFVMYSGVNTSSTIDFNADVVSGEKVQDFTTNFFLNFSPETTNPEYGNGQGDGFSFNFGQNISGTNEMGVSTGLAIRVIPFSWGGNNIQIVWNDTVIGSTSLNDQAEQTQDFNFSMSVSSTGSVSVSMGSFSVNAQIPGTEWQQTDQSGWDFLLAGRTGANGGEAYVDDLNISANIIDTTVVCFCTGTGILTDKGVIAIEDLQPGDLIATRDNGYQALRWIGSQTVTPETLEHSEKLRPILIKAGSLGNGLPERDLRVSRQHRVLVTSKIAERMFGNAEVLVPACKLIGMPGISIDHDSNQVTYHHMLFDQHEIVFSEGAATESLYTGAEAIKTLSAASIREIFTLFPELANAEQAPTPARLLAKGGKSKKLVARHLKNQRALAA